MSQPRAHTPRRPSRTVSKSPRADDSPSQQLFRDLERALSQVKIYETERQKVQAFNRRAYYDSLDARERERTQADVAALDAVAARHRAIRQEAEAVLEKHQQEEAEKERKRKEEEERRAREQAAREKAARERREREEAERKAKIEREKAAAQKAAAEKAQAEAEEARRQEREATAAREKAAQEKAEQEKAEQERAQREAVDKATAEQKEAADKATAEQKAAAAAAAAAPEVEQTHRRYLQIHRRLKKFRKEFTTMAKTDAQLKPTVGDMRRAIRVSVGQLTDDKTTNKKPTDRVKTTVLSTLQSVPSPPVKLSDYLAVPLADPDTTIPSLTLYVLTIFSKAVHSAYVGECAVNPKAAEPIGTLTAQIFSLPEIQFPLAPAPNLHAAPTTSLFSVLLCKFHATAPQLFGISSPESTATSSQARLRMGWRREALSDRPEKAFVPEQRQLERLTGLGAGFASVALRNFAKAKNLRNPYPPSHFWESMAALVNTPVDQVETGHLILMKAMLDGGWERVLLFWGNVGVAALRTATVDWVARLPDPLRTGPAGMAIVLMAEAWAKEKNFHLT